MLIVVPFNISNVGVYDLNDITLSFQIAMNYSHVDYPVPGQNQSRIELIFNKTQNFGDILHGKNLIDNFTFFLFKFLI